jgi:hypothetical protein
MFAEGARRWRTPIVAGVSGARNPRGLSANPGFRTPAGNKFPAENVLV